MSRIYQQNKEKIKSLVCKALEVEYAGIEALINRLDDAVVEAVKLILDCQGKIAVLGMGKSGHIGRKIASTLASTGTPAFFLHPSEALHGDLGSLTRSDVALILSHSGQTEEILRLLGQIKRMGIPFIAMTGNPESELARKANLHLDISVPEEACPLNLAPTASTTATLALGDALAVCLLEIKGFQPQDFARLHPGGNLGKQLVTTVADIMDTEYIPQVSEQTSVQDSVSEIHRGHYGITAITDAKGQLLGAFSLGDLLRLHHSQPKLRFLTEPIARHLNRNPQRINSNALVAEALFLMETKHIRCVFVCDSGQKLQGMLGIYESLKAIDY